MSASSTKINETLKERDHTYGDFTDHAKVAMELKDYMRSNKGWRRLTPDKQHALDYIMDKVTRILNGDPDHKDSWHDIAGYATLAEQRCGLGLKN